MGPAQGGGVDDRARGVGGVVGGCRSGNGSQWRELG